MTDEPAKVSISALIGALRGEGVADEAIVRVLVAALELDEPTAQAHVAGRSSSAVDDFAGLHALLDAANQRKDWPEMLSIIMRLSELESDPLRRAKYLYTAAMTQRVELKDYDAALESFEMVLDCDPTMVRAFERITAMLTELRDWKRLERTHRKMIHRVRGTDAALEFNLWRALAEIYRDRLDHRSAALAAYQMAAGLKPDDEAVQAAVQALEAGQSE